MAQQPPRQNAARGGGGPGASSGGGSRAAEKPQGETFFLGRYRVVDEIGIGGMASVHLARMDGPGGFQKWVAIKRIHPHLVEDDQFVDMFLDEARIAAGINHANVAQVFDLGKDDNTYWIAMEYLHGEPLREIMRRCEERGQLIAAELASRIAADAAEGLHAAHELRGKNGQLLGLVHRDVTPHNLFVTYDGYTKVVDFGIAKVADRLASTRAGTLKGKLAYMSPEQVRGAEVDRTTDIFALGVVLWELTTGHRLFRMDTDLDTLEKVQACIVPPPSTIVPDYPVELESIVMKALSKRKEDRYATARELSRALQGFLMRRGVMVGPEEVGIFAREVFADRIQKREAHLAWASEVTSTVDLDKVRMGSGRGISSEESEAGSMASQASMSAAGSMSGAQQPRSSQGHGSPGHQGGHKGAAGQAGAAQPGGRAPMAAPGRTPPPPRVAPPPPPSSPNLPPLAQQARTTNRDPGARPPPSGYGQSSLLDEEEDIPTTISMREDAAHLVLPRGHRGPAQDGQRAPSPPSFGQSPTFGAPPSHGLQPGALPPGALQTGSSLQPMAVPAFGMPPSARGNMQQSSQGQGPQGQGPQGQGYGQGMHGQGMPQSMGQPLQNVKQAAIETVLSMPRPDAAALWLAKQDVAKRAGRQSLAVLVALAVLTAVCVAGLATILYLKLVAAPAIAADTEPAPSAAPGAVAQRAPGTGVATSAPVVVTARSTATPAATTAPVQGGPLPVSPATATKPAEEPGYLTIICKPFCDDVRRGGESLGPSPIVKSPVPPGQHRVVLVRAGSPDKVISVLVASGEVHKETITMK